MPLHHCLEVAVVVPSVERSPQWQFVEQDYDRGGGGGDGGGNNGGGLWEPVTSTSSRSATDSSRFLSTEELEAYACITQITNQVTVTCQVLPEAPHLFCLSRISTTGQAPLVAYYALPQQLQAQVIDTAMHVLDIMGSEIRVVLVQDSGTIWYWQVNEGTLHPTSNIRRVEFTNALPQIENNSSSSLFWLRKSAITFLSPSVLCVAWTPFLLAMDFTNLTVAVWSSSLTMQAMKARKSTISSIVYNSMTYFAGTTAEMVQDMSAILTLTTSYVEHSGQVVVYSWHDDGILRQWMLSANSWQQPIAVYEYDLATDKQDFLPLTTLEGARLQATPVVDGNWTLAVFPNNTTTSALASGSTTAYQDGGAAVGGADELPRIYLVKGQGIPMEERKQYHTPQEPVVVDQRAAPSAESQLVAWQWTTNTELQTLWKSRDEQWEQWTFSATSDTWEPIAETKGWWDGLAEERAMAWLDVLPTTTEYGTAEEAWHAVDQAYLKYLLRPRRVRGTGTPLPPAAQVIRQAFTELTGTTPAMSSKSIGVEVLIALHDWRKIQQAQKQERRTHSTPSQHHGRRQVTNKTPKQYYESLQREMAQQAAIMAEDMEPASPAAAVSPLPAMGLTQQVQAHVECWQQLLQRIYQLESSARAVLCARWASPSSSSLQDAAVVVRGQAVSIVARAGQQPTVNGVQSVLDNTAIRLLLYVDDHPTYAKALAIMEEGLVQDLLKGDLALRPKECLDDMVAGLGVFNDNPLWNEHILRPSDANDLVHGFIDTDITIEEHIREIKRLPIGYGLAGLNLLPLDSCQDTPFDRDLSADLDNVHWRLSTSILTMRCLDSYRRLMLGRFMVLNLLGVRKEVSKAAMWGYLQTLSLLVTCAQHVPLPLVMGTSPLPQLDLHLDDSISPPKKRPSVDNHVPSFLEQPLGATEKTTTLDAFLIGVTRTNFGGHAPPSALSFPVLVAKAVFTSLYSPTQEVTDQFFLPELTLLKSCTNEIMDYPSYVLWLLSPAFAMKDDAREQRRSALAQCLLRLAEDEPDQAQGTAMAERAFELMRFDPHQIDQGVERISKLHRYVGRHSRFLLDVLDLAGRAVRECTKYYTEDIWKNDKFRQVLSIYFSAALGAREWKTAAAAAVMHPDPVSRSEDLKRLVRHMVDNGAVADLVQMSASDKDEMSGPRLEGIDMYATAMACLGGMASPDAYLHAVDNKEPLSDYQGALFAIHVANNQWKRAAESLDLRCVHAFQALSHEIDAISGERVLARERLAVEDLALSAVGRAIAMSHVEDNADKYLVSGESGTYATLPLKLLDSPSIRAKRSRSLLSEGNTANDEEKDRLDRFMRDVDVDLSSARSLCFQILHEGGKVGAEEAKVFLQIPASLKSDQLLISELFKNGFYHYGLMMGQALRTAQKGHYMGIDVFHDIVSHLACNFLIPLMLGKETFPKPDIEQMYASLHAIAPTEAPRLPTYSKALKASDVAATCIRQMAGEILRRVTTAHTTPTTPLAHDVVGCLLSEHGPAVLPEWLHNLMVHGAPFNSNDYAVPGLFAKRSSPTSQTYSGDPSSLVTKYTYAGMYEEACRTVNETLAVQNASAAARRLPEKGDMDFVPYPKIDLLYNLIDVSIGKGRYSEDQVARLKKSQKEIEASLERHFDLLEISEMGLKSARAMQL